MLDSGREICLPDIASRDQTKGQDDIGGFHCCKDLVELTRSTIKVDMETGDGKSCNEIDVGVKAREVCREHNFWGNRGQFRVGSYELRLKIGSAIENEDWLVDLNPFGISSFEVAQELLVDGQDLV